MTTPPTAFIGNLGKVIANAGREVVAEKSVLGTLKDLMQKCRGARFASTPLENGLNEMRLILVEGDKAGNTLTDYVTENHAALVDALNEAAPFKLRSMPKWQHGNGTGTESNTLFVSNLDRTQLHAVHSHLTAESFKSANMVTWINSLEHQAGTNPVGGGVLGR